MEDKLKENLYQATLAIAKFAAGSGTPSPSPSPSPAPSPSPSPTPTPTPSPTIGKPSDLIGANFTVMAPFSKTGTTDSPENMYITKAEADSRYKPWMFVKGGAVVYKANAGGVHSTNSKYPRCENREMKDANWTEGVWANTGGTHTLEGTYSVTHNLVKRKQFVIAQIHDASSDVVEVAFDDGKLVLFSANKAVTDVLNSDQKLDDKFTVKVVAKDGKIQCYYNGTLKATVSATGSSWYYKSGCYLQTNVANWSEAADATAEVSIYALKITHS